MKNIVWQSMKMKYFALLLQNKALTLQRLSDQSGTAEYNDYTRLIYNLTSQRAYKEKQMLQDGLQELRQSIYFGCFYGNTVIKYNMIKTFGKDHGVAIAFEKDTLINRFKEYEKTEIDSREEIKWDNVKYGSDILEQYDTIEKIFDNYLEFSFIKAEEYSDEHEFRVACNLRERHMEPHGFNALLSERLKRIPISLDDILKIAIPRGDDLETLLKTLLDSKNLNFKEEMDAKSVFERPIIIYNRQ